MDIATAALAVVVIGTIAVVWVREQRHWKEFHATAGHRPESVVRLHEAFRRAGVRSRYRTVGSVFHSWGSSGTTRTMKLQVHRDDLRRAHQVRSELRDFYDTT